MEPELPPGMAPIALDKVLAEPLPEPKAPPDLASQGAVPIGRVSPPAPKPQLALPPYPGHGAPAPVSEEDRFFSDDATDELPLGISRRRTGLMVGLAIGAIAAVAAVVFVARPAPSVDKTPPADTTAQDTPSQQGPDTPAPVDHPAVATAPVTEDAGTQAALVAAPEDAGPAAVAQAPSPAAPTKDAGAQVATAPAERSPAEVDAEYARLIKQALLSIQSERFKTATIHYRKALALKPESAEAKMGLGIALVNSVSTNSGFREAVALLVDAVKTDDKNARAWLALGIAYQNLGKDKSAAAPYRKYLALEPKGEFAGEVRSALKQIGE